MSVQPPSVKESGAAQTNDGKGDKFSVPVRIIEDPIEAQRAREREAKSDKHEADDLIAQQRAADAGERAATASERQVIPTWGQLAFAVLGTVLLLYTLALTRQSNRNALQAVGEAEKANALVKENSQRELRAYISVSPEGINPLRNTKAVVGHVIIRNVGKIIAQEVVAFVCMDVKEGKEISVFPISTTARRTIGSMHPTAEIRMGSADWVHEKQMTLPIPANKRGGTKGEYIYVWGQISYKDGLDLETERVTRFCYRYDLESHGRKRTRVFIAKDIARYHRYGNYAT